MSERGVASESRVRRFFGALAFLHLDRWPVVTDARARVMLLVLLVPYYGLSLGSDALTHGDEAYWISAGSKAASLVFVERNLRSPDWQIGSMASVLDLHHPTETAANRNPKLAALLIGSSVRWLGAPQPERWSKEYAFRESPEWNRRRGLLPSRATLLAGRLPVAGLSLLAALWFFQILRTLVGPGVSLAGALLLATSPLVMLLCRRAMLDGPAYAFSIGAVLWTIRACVAPTRWTPMLMAGLLACAALSSKLNAGILVPVLGFAFLFEAVRRGSGALLARAGVSALLAAALFVVANPTLYLAPYEGMLSMLRIGSEIGGLGDHFGNAALPTFSSRVAAAYRLLLVEHGVLTSRLALPLDGLLLAVGAGILVARARRQEAARVLLLWLAVAVLAVCVWPPVRWDRYFLPAMAPIVAAEILALVVAVPLLMRLAARLLPGSQQAPEPARDV